VSRGVRSLTLLLVLACSPGNETATPGNETATPGNESAGDPSGELELRDAWVEPPAAGRGPAGGFLTVANGSERAYRLIGASSPAAGRVEIHRSWIEDGVAHMERVKRLAIGPGETLRLEPGGLHLMLFDAPGLSAANAVALRLEFADGPRRTVRARVRPAGSGPPGSRGGPSVPPPGADRGVPDPEH